MAAVWVSPVDGADDQEVAVRAYNDIVSKGSMRTLKHEEWLGDEVCTAVCTSVPAARLRMHVNSEYSCIMHGMSISWDTRDSIVMLTSSCTELGCVWLYVHMYAHVCAVCGRENETEVSGRVHVS